MSFDILMTDPPGRVGFDPTNQITRVSRTNECEARLKADVSQVGSVRVGSEVSNQSRTILIVVCRVEHGHV